MIRQAFLVVFFLCLGGPVLADTVRLAVTTSFQNSGLADVLLPEIRADIDLNVQLIAVGTGQALRLGAAGDVDAVLVHSQGAEKEFVAKGYGTHRRQVMYNDFVIVGPRSDLAGVAAAQSAEVALTLIAAKESLFVSRGDDSGTHKRELALWAKAGIGQVDRRADWYRSTGAGMGAALNAASAMNAYVLADRASWLKFGNKGELELLFSGDPGLFNQYSFIPVDAVRFPHVRNDLVNKLEVWLTSPRAARLINDYKINGETMFVFNATPK